MRCNRLLMGAILLFELPLIAPVDAADLAPLSGAELHMLCAEYVESSPSEAARSCVAYIRGFIEGSSRVVLRTDGTDGDRRESFSERALRTRLGRPRVPEPEYCVSSAISIGEFITQILAHAEINPPADDVSASVLLYGTLSQFHRC